VIIDGDHPGLLIDDRRRLPEGSEVRAAPGRHQQALTAHFRSAGQPHCECFAVVTDPPAGEPTCTSMPSRPKTSASSAPTPAPLAAAAGRVPPRWSPAPRSGRRPARVGADRAAAEHDDRLRHPLGPRSPRGWSSTACRPAPGWAGWLALSPVAMTIPRRARSTSPLTVTSPGAVIRPYPPEQPAALAGEPVSRHRVIPVVGRLRPDPVRHRCPVRGHRGAAGHAGDTAAFGKQVSRAIIILDERSPSTGTRRRPAWPPRPRPQGPPRPAGLPRPRRPGPGR